MKQTGEYLRREKFAAEIFRELIMKSKKLAGATFAAFLTIFAVGAQAQTSDSQYVISAKAGGINSASGDVKVRRSGANGFEWLSTRDALADRDRVSTGAGGRVEMLLSPGAYFRAAENSEFELENSSLDNLRVKLNAGSAIIEATGADGANMFVEIKTPDTNVAVNKRGIYRINVLPPARQTAVYVREGYALVGRVKVKEGRTITVGAGGAASESTIAKFDEKERDAFDLWSESRAETLVATNKRLTRSAIRDSYTAYNRSGFSRGYRGSGLWLYNSSFGGHTFLPFYAGLSSPYGYGYQHGFGFSSYGFGSIFTTPGRRIIYAPTHNRTHTTTHQSSPRHISSGHHRRGH